MPRNLSPAVSNAAASAQKRLAWFLEIVFANETIYCWTGMAPVTPAGPAWDSGSSFPYGQKFIGVGWLGRVSDLPQNSELTAENIRLSLSGIPTELVADAINGVRFSGSATLWLAFLDQNNNVIPDPLQMWQGETDVPTLTEGANTCTLDITVENSLIALNLASNRRFTTLDQQLDYPGDSGFDYVTAMQDLYLPYPNNMQNGGADIGPGNQNDAPSYANAVVLATTSGGAPPVPMNSILETFISCRRSSLL